MKTTSKIRKLRFYTLVGFLATTVLTTAACEDLEVADNNSGFRSVPTIERAPNPERAPTIAAAPTTTQFEGFKQAPTAETFEGFELAPTAEAFEGFESAPTTTRFEGFSEGNPCETFMENPTPRNTEDAVKWVMQRLDGEGGDIDPNDSGRVVEACQAVLNN